MSERGLILFHDELNPALADIFHAQVPPGFTLATRGPGEPLPPLEEADYLLVAADHVPAPEIHRLKRARLIQKVGVGYDNIDLEAAAEMSIPVAIAAGANSIAVAEHAIMMMLALQRQLIPIANATAAGEWRMWQHRHECFELADKHVGLIGLGSIGREVASRVRAFGCEVAYYDTLRQPEGREQALNLRFMPFKELLAWADIVSLHVPLNDATRHLINRESIERMKPSAILINTARGPVVNIRDLADALRAGRLFGAGLDVHDPEPIPPGYPLLDCPNVILTPHSAAGTRDTQRRVVRAAMENVLRVASGQVPLNQIKVSLDQIKRPRIENKRQVNGHET